MCIRDRYQRRVREVQTSQHGEGSGRHVLTPRVVSDPNQRGAMEGFSTNLGSPPACEPEQELNDPVLIAGLQDPRNRTLVLKIESSIETFINSGRARLEFPPLVSYQRLIVHRIAEYYALAHTVAAPEGPDNGKRKVVLGRTPDTHLPAVRLRDAIPAPDAKAPKAKPKAIAKPSVRAERHGGSKNKADAPSLEQREEAYAAARARIMGQEGGEVGDAPEQAEKESGGLPEQWVQHHLAAQNRTRQQQEEAMEDPDYCRRNVSVGTAGSVQRQWQQAFPGFQQPPAFPSGFPQQPAQTQQAYVQQAYTQQAYAQQAYAQQAYSQQEFVQPGYRAPQSFVPAPAADTWAQRPGENTWAAPQHGRYSEQRQGWPQSWPPQPTEPVAPQPTAAPPPAELVLGPDSFPPLSSDKRQSH
eukprot:TRINITY_DN16956_c0_g1_i1.p1 TRINITY_DN16956_c0_g1~~TRINITY_DN16956_c0_g1_i1.p1  ORF type:complete len:414 (-),score=55.36 TRINITY_DN16956_c0_g1_i1:73-1314(-)